MFCPVELALVLGKKTAMKQSKRVYLDTDRDTVSRWNALCYMAYNLTGSDDTHNPRRLERGDGIVDAENMGYCIWCSEVLERQVKRS